MNQNELKSRLEELSITVALLVKEESDPTKKKHLDLILVELLRMIDILKRSEEQPPSKGLLERMWKKVCNTAIRHGLAELFERLADLGNMT